MDQQTPTGTPPGVPIMPPPGWHPPPPPPRRSFWLRLFVLVLLLAVIGSLMLNFALLGALALNALDSDNKIQERFHSRSTTGVDKVAVITVEGSIVEGDGFIKKQIDRVKEDKQVKAAVLRIISPGGTISGSDFLFHQLRKVVDQRKLPLVVSMGGLCASGGYYLAMAVGDEPNTIFAEPTTWTGSIGVVIPHYNLSGLMDHWGLKEDSIASHRLKTMGSFFKPMSEEERKIFQALVDDGFDRFKEIVRKGRPKFRKDPAALDKLATGQIFTAQQALSGGLVDKLGFLDDAIARAAELAHLKVDDVRVIKYKPEPSLTSLLWGVAPSRASAFDAAALLDGSAPRAYYLYTALPPLFSSPR